ncbi:uncharacterized protein QC763_510390 [Podospora pseudopauciseta]|uniref:NadR/Ttd14 AAA domain-containing protein n=1 Tax=Podospora pseudopauciseta TaxID=2093780 RepID=A0ABR0HB40_9PEZI|nr:hypothetical protein QC763_510390 [Podospora pseudopauciseta]
MSQPPNIYIVGAQCTGKMTLVKNLHANFEFNSSHEPPVLITEVARTVLKKHSFTAADPIAYALRYVEGRANQLIQSDERRELRTRMQDAVVVLCEASEEARSWLADDGVRLMPEDVDDLDCHA